MALSNFLSKLNWRLILIHFIACWFFYHALWQLGFLYDYKFLELLSRYNVFDLMKHNNYEEVRTIFKDYQNLQFGSRLSMDLVYAALTGLAGILIGFVISLLISIKNKWFWVNSLIIFLATFGVYFLDRFYWYHIRFALMFPGKLFKSNQAYNLTSGLFLLAIGLILFFWNRIVRFIDGRKDASPSPMSALNHKSNKSFGLTRTF